MNLFNARLEVEYCCAVMELFILHRNLRFWHLNPGYSRNDQRKLLCFQYFYFLRLENTQFTVKLSAVPKIDGYSLTCHTKASIMELTKRQKISPFTLSKMKLKMVRSFIREKISSSYSFIIKIKRERGTFLISSLREKILILNICYTTLSSFKFTFCSITFT